MKNIILLPTEQESRFSIGTMRTDFGESIITNVSEYTNQNLYITSEDEIKEGDVFINLNNLLVANKITFHGIETENGDVYDFELSKRVILTTDQSLIESGIQEISEEFLQWYANNSSCEFVEVEKDVYQEIIELAYAGDFQTIEYESYKITIPQQKQTVEKQNHEGKELTAEEVMEGRSNVYEFIDFIGSQKCTLIPLLADNNNAQTTKIKK